MGTFTIPIEVGDQEGRQYIQMDALVDTGSSHTSIPEDILHKLGIRVRGQRHHRLADNTLVYYPWGEARVRIMGEDISVVVVFMPQGSDPLLGSSTLESFALGVDPLGHRLVTVDQLSKRYSLPTDL